VNHRWQHERYGRHGRLTVLLAGEHRVFSHGTGVGASGMAHLGTTPARRTPCGCAAAQSADGTSRLLGSFRADSAVLAMKGALVGFRMRSTPRRRGARQHRTAILATRSLEPWLSAYRPESSTSLKPGPHRPS
jgi:hypothetical protein